MALLNPTFVFGLIVLVYLSSFVFFALLRIVTGISIQRIGYLSLRRLAYTPRDGCRFEIRGLGFSVHRPTFAQPTWLSIVLDELVVTVDIRQLEGQKTTDPDTDDSRADGNDGSREKPRPSRKTNSRAQSAGTQSQTWRSLTEIKERIKKLHTKVKWLRMVDVVATNSTINVVDVGRIQVGSFTMAVDTRRTRVDRARFLFRRSEAKKQERQAEWILTVRSVLFTADGKESLDVLDHGVLNVHGYLYASKEGLGDSTVALKLGRVHVPFDDLHLCVKRYQSCRRKPEPPFVDEPIDTFVGDVIQEVDEPRSTNEHLVQTVSGSKEFFSSILRGIKEVQFAVSFFSVSKKVDAVKPGAAPIQLNAAMKEVGVDLHRLDPRSPAHRMYFPAKDIAHEALAAALSISVGLDDGQGKHERLIYVPMATTTVRTTLPSKTVELSLDGTAEDKNANILFENSVITSPSVDLNPRHLPLLIALLKPRPKAPRAQKDKRRALIPRLLPKAIIKLSMHEPVIRIKLSPLQKTEDPDDFDLIISSISSISVDVESSHSPVEDSHYALTGAMRLQSHHLYYQTNERERFNLITTDSFDMKLHLSASPDVTVDCSGNIRSFYISMVRPEIIDGLRQIVKELRIEVEPEKRTSSKATRRQNFLRSAPRWLSRFQMEATDVNVEVGGIDEDISDDTRGVCLHLDALSGEYREHKPEKNDGIPQRMPRTRTHSRSLTQSDSDLTPSPRSPRTRRKPQHHGDGRRLVIHSRGIEAQIIESMETLELEPFLNIPRLELAFSAMSDNHGPMFHIQSHIRSITAQYSLYRHYSIGVAIMTFRKAFMKTGRDAPRTRQQETTTKTTSLAPPVTPGPFRGEERLSTVPEELVTVNIKASLVQVKAAMPHDPPIMLHIYGLEAGQHRWSKPYLESKLVRLYVEPPRMQQVWARMISIKQIRVDLRKSKRKTASGSFVEESMVDINSEAMRFGVPHEVVLNRITDNFVNVFKAIQQLHHRFKTGTNEYILEKHPEGPKEVPKVSIRTRKFMFELEDGAFEWKLGMIYRTGRVEQMQRLAREDAFRQKMKKVRNEESRNGSSRVRSRSAYHRGRSDHSSGSWFRSRSLDFISPAGSGPGPDRDRIPRYDPESETLGINGYARVSEAEARSHLDMFNAQTWKKRIDRECKLAQACMKELRSSFWAPDYTPDEITEQENILEVPQRPALMSVIVSDLHFIIDKPTFPLSELPDFLHKVGKGMPRDMKYGLLIPMHVAIEMDEARVSLRDYPLPLLHIPTMKGGQSAKMQAVSLKTNFVLAEEFRGPESTRRVRVNVVPPKGGDTGTSNGGGFAIEVRRTIGPVKSYSNVYMDINTALPTRITWGPSYQPAIQDMMMVVESFTKPQLDPSERVGFWDKLRLVFHSHIHVAWRGDGDMHLALKGTRDPYQITGNGAGFLMCWRNDVRWNINTEDDPKRFMTVDSGEYVLAIPDFTHQVREVLRREQTEGSWLPNDALNSGATFKKVVMKLSGKVQWMAGLTFEAAIENGKRNFDFKPHYEVILKNPKYAKPDGDLPYDAMRGFRSRHIHLSTAVRAPEDRNWMSEDVKSSTSYNAVHLTPRFFTHFFTWWGLFSQPMSLPIRQGTLFPGREKNSKKFGRHLATVKYSILLAPLFLSHIYKHKDVEDYSENAVSATGLKVRLDSFMLDLHQRREEFNTLGKGKNAQSRTSGIKIHAAQLDLANADLRAVSASLGGTTTEAIKRGNLSTLVADQDEKPDLSRFHIPDNDYSWIDMDDFVELDWILPTEPHPHTKILPLGFAPRLSYFRQTDIGGTIAGDPSRTSPFGNEPTNFCLMTNDDDPKKVQIKLIEERLEQLRHQMARHAREVGEAELKVIQCDSKDHEIVHDFEALRKHTSVLEGKKDFLEEMLQQVYSKSPHSHVDRKDHDNASSKGSIGTQGETLNIPATAEFESEFNNRFILHNMQLKWNNVLRNIVLRYIHQNSQRRGFIYYLSRPAVKFILDIVEEQNRAKFGKPARSQTAPVGGAPSATPTTASPENANQVDIDDRIRDILGDGQRHHSASFSTQGDGTGLKGIEDLTSGISDEFSPQSSYHVRLIAPQIQLQSEKNKKNVVLVTAKGMELKVMEIMDKQRISDSVSGLVQRRFLVNMDSTQFFVTHHKWFMTHLVSMYAGSRYGTVNGSSWPPWVPMEIMFDFQVAPFGFKRVVQKTSALLRYDKHNTLRLKYSAEVNLEDTAEASSEVSETRMDNLWVEFPQVRALCNSSQYYAMYVIVLDLLMYSEPLEKTRNERLEKIMLASDFSDLTGAPEKIERLQERIRQMEEIKTHFQLYSKYLDQRGWADRLSLERDLASCEDELFFVMKAITTSQRKYEVNVDSNALLKWNILVRDIVWHLVQDSNDPLVELQLKNLIYDRTDNSDGSHMNLIRVGKVLGLNLLPDATYPEIIGLYHDPEKIPQVERGSRDMIRVYWYMLEAIAGITVMDRFEVDLFPMRIQLEYEVGKRLMEYIFPGLESDDKKDDAKGDSHFLLKQSLAEPDGDDDESINSSITRLDTPSPDKESSSFSTRAGSLELRLRPTLTSNTPERNPRKNLTVNTGDNPHGFRLFRAAATKSVTKKSSFDSLKALTQPKPGNIGRSSTGMSKDSRDSGGAEGKKRFGLRNKSTGEDNQASDDLTKMISRASNYMTFSYIRMQSVVLCLSYKGRDQRNFEDVHDFVFRMPVIEWQNKTWSNVDLAMAFKKAVIRALLSHTGAIIGNKFSKHRPNAEQRNRLRELANSSVLIASASSAGSQNYAGSVHDSDDSSSLYGHSPVDFSRSPPRSLRGSTHSSIPAPRPASRSSSIASGRSYKSSQNTTGLPMPTYLTMTPPTPVEGRRGSNSGLGIDLLRPGSSHVLGSSPQRFKRTGTGSGDRPMTSHSSMEGKDRRKSGASGLRDKIGALAYRMSHRENSGAQEEESETGEEENEEAPPKPSLGKRMSWAPGRTKTG
ncbi:Protein SABRE [Amphichorda felina]